MRVRRVALTAYVGKQLTVSIPNRDSARDPEDLSTFEAFGKVVDSSGALVLDLTPTVGGEDGMFNIDVLVDAEIPPGWYSWRGGVTDSSGDEDVRYEGPVHFRGY